MDFSLSPRATDLRDRVRAFVDTEIEPVEADLHAEILTRRESGGDPWTPSPVIKDLQAKARAQGLWNLFLPEEHARTVCRGLRDRWRRGAVQRRLRARRRGDGPLGPGAAGVQLQRPRHRQHGGAAAATARPSSSASGSSRCSTRGSAARSA